MFHAAALRNDGPLMPKDKELVAAYVSGLNACQYCFGVHSQTAQAFGVPEEVLTRLLNDVDQPQLTKNSSHCCVTRAS